MKILIVEDDEPMAALLERGLEREGHVTTVTVDGAEGLDFAASRAFDVMILDVMLPVMNGLEIARRLRDQGVQTPILMLTARDTPRDAVAGLDTGADDYVTKPFSFEELLARTRALARRVPVPRSPAWIVFDLRLVPASHTVTRGERKIQLTPREFQLLEILIRRAGQVLSRDTLIEGVWGHEADVERNTVDVFIGTLRRKIDGPADTTLIHTIRGVGFCLKNGEP